ncbi:MAG: acetate--CoA ligase family protein, partial [Pseudomonadota bacterium]
MAINKKAVRTVIDKAIKAKRSALNAAECKRICSAYEIPLPRDGMAKSAAQAASIGKRLGFPVVMKIQSEDILHKTDAGGVVVGVQSASEARKAYNAILKNAKSYNKKANIDGVQVQKMLSSDGAQEVLVGAVTDPSFGKLVAFGLGGILVEVMKDVTFRLAPTTRRDAASMLNDIQGAEVLKGVRGSSGVDRQALTKIIQNVSKLIADFPEIA